MVEFATPRHSPAEGLVTSPRVRFDLLVGRDAHLEETFDPVADTVSITILDGANRPLVGLVGAPAVVHALLLDALGKIQSATDKLQGTDRINRGRATSVVAVSAPAPGNVQRTAGTQPTVNVYGVDVPRSDGGTQEAA